LNAPAAKRNPKLKEILRAKAPLRAPRIAIFEPKIGASLQPGEHPSRSDMQNSLSPTPIQVRRAEVDRLLAQARAADEQRRLQELAAQGMRILLSVYNDKLAS
jgi:hypothetical protein